MYEDDYWFNKKVEEKKEINEKQEQLENKLLFAGNIFMYLIIAYAFIIFLVIFFYKNLFYFTDWRFLTMITPSIFIPNLGENPVVSPYLLGGLNFIISVFFFMYMFILHMKQLIICKGIIRPIGKNKYNVYAYDFYVLGERNHNSTIFGIKGFYINILLSIPVSILILYMGKEGGFANLEKFKLVIFFWIQPLLLGAVNGLLLSRIIYSLFIGKIEYTLDREKW